MPATHSAIGTPTADWMRRIKYFNYDDPQLLKDTMRFFYDVQTEFGLAQFEAGADAVVIVTATDVETLK